MKRLSLLILLSLFTVIVMVLCPVNSDSVDDIVNSGFHFMHQGQNEEALHAFNQEVKKIEK